MRGSFDECFYEQIRIAALPRASVYYKYVHITEISIIIMISPTFYNLTLQKYIMLQKTPKIWDNLRGNVMNGINTS